VTPLNEDFRQLRRIYEHTDASRTVARASEADLNLFGPTTWPEPDSEEDVMALPLDEETLVLTFVIWAEEEDLSETDITGTELGADSDGDHVADADELNLYQTDPTVADTDGDGMVDGDELFATETDPLLWDDVSAAVSGELVAESRASVPALQQVPAAAASPIVPTNAAFPTDTDLDADNYPDASESAIGLDPGNPDTDSDGVADGDEGTLYGTDPLSADTDDDGLTDGAELFGVGTDPLIWDTDSDGLKDGETTPPSARSRSGMRPVEEDLLFQEVECHDPSVRRLLSTGSSHRGSRSSAGEHREARGLFAWDRHRLSLQRPGQPSGLRKRGSGEPRRMLGEPGHVLVVDTVTSSFTPRRRARRRSW
jgi:hypothetical protein